MIKKHLKLLPLMLLPLLGASFTSCDDKDEPISSEQLPIEAKTFLSQYFPEANVLSTEKDNNEYEVILNDGTRIDFNKLGEWKDVDAVDGRTLPTGFYPDAIDTYISDYMNGIGINEISKEKRGYDVELLTGTELLFGYEGEFLTFNY